jgi:transmembrane sensor
LEDRDHKQILLHKFLSGTCTKEELEQLFDYLKQDNQGEYDAVMQQVWQELEVRDRIRDKDADRMFRAILQKGGSTAGKQEEDHPVRHLSKSKENTYPWHRWAAVFVGLLLLTGASYYFWQADRFITHNTGFGQTASITLPDQSVVKLNGNSSLRYPAAWHGSGAREVWLEGEAFFSVVHTTSDQRFLVHTPDQVSVEVLGTEFNVSTRESRKAVVLVSGKVRLNLPQEPAQEGQASQRAVVEMEPGEMVQFGKSQPLVQYTKKTVNTELYASWTDNLLLLDETPIRQIVLMLQDTYGLTVHVPDASILDQKVSGSTPTDNVDLLLAGMSRSFNLNITRHQNAVTIERKPVKKQLKPMDRKGALIE